MTGATDFLGREIKAGDWVCYPVRRGSSMWLNKLRITQVTPLTIKGTNTEGRWVEVRNLKNVIVVTEPTV